jgi:hypothetical protein
MKNHRTLIATLLILALVAGLAASLGFFTERDKEYRQELDNLYKKSYFEAMDSIDDVELKLSKASVSTRGDFQETTLLDVWKGSEVAASNLAQLSARDAQMEPIIKFLNQVGDYCKYLAQKAKDDGLDDQDLERLDKLHEIMKSLKDAFNDTGAGIMSGEKLYSKLGGNLGLVGDCYEHFNNDSSVDYPEMIYDGPFSDGLCDRETKFLANEPEVSVDEAGAAVREKFPDITRLENKGETAGNIPSYYFEIEWKEGAGVAFVSKKGGKIYHYSSERAVTNPELTEDECKEIASRKVKAMGFDDMSAVWITNNDSRIYINFAFEKDNVIYYPDLIKVCIAADDGDMLSFEAANYLYNHTGERAIPSGIASVSDARAMVSAKIDVKDSRLTVIPTEWNTEILAYEFSGTYKEKIYFVYIDADALDLVKVMMVIDSEDGKLIS